MADRDTLYELLTASSLYRNLVTEVRPEPRPAGKSKAPNSIQLCIDADRIVTIFAEPYHCGAVWYSRGALSRLKMARTLELLREERPLRVVSTYALEAVGMPRNDRWLLFSVKYIVSSSPEGWRFETGTAFSAARGISPQYTYPGFFKDGKALAQAIIEDYEMYRTAHPPRIPAEQAEALWQKLRYLHAEIEQGNNLRNRERHDPMHDHLALMEKYCLCEDAKVRQEFEWLHEYFASQYYQSMNWCHSGRDDDRPNDW